MGIKDFDEQIKDFLSYLECGSLFINPKFPSLSVYQLFMEIPYKAAETANGDPDARILMKDEDFDEPSSIAFERPMPAGAPGIHLDDVNARFRSLDIQDQHPYVPFIDLMAYPSSGIPSQHYHVLDWLRVLHPDAIGSRSKNHWRAGSSLTWWNLRNLSYPFGLLVNQEAANLKMWKSTVRLQVIQYLCW